MSEPAARDRAVVAPLCVMMFVQFFIWGAWYVTLGPFMGAMKMSGGIGDAYSVGPLAAIISPFFLGMVADRFFATQRVLGVMHLLGGLVLLAAPTVAAGLPLREVTADDGTVTQARAHLPFVALLLAHMLCYMPTLGLSNTLAFHNLKRQEDFPLVRVLGTIGWIVAGWTVGMLARSVVPEAQRAASPMFFYVAGGAGLLLGLYSFALPHTPPPAAGKKATARDVLGLNALALMKDPSFAVFLVCSFLICIPLAGYYAFAGVFAGAVGIAADQIPMTMSYGQVSEIFFMLVMPLCFARLGVKWMLLVGMLAWAARYGLFAAAWDGAGGEHVKWMVLGGILLHGICYDFFFVTGQVYVDKRAPVAIRGQAQGLLVLVTQGLGLGIGAQAFQALYNHYTPTGGTPAWHSIWLWPAAAAAAILVVFAASFRDRGAGAKEGPPAHAKA